MNIKKVSLSDVATWDKNPRNIKTKDFERLKRQILELGVYKPLICVKENGKYITLGGNMRLRALEALSLSEIDISIVDAPDEATKIKYALSDNDRAGEYDEQALAELAYPHMEEIQLDDYKLDVGQAISLKDVIEDYAPDVDGEDEVPEVDDGPAITKMGDLFTLGKHRLLCGDATKEEDAKRLMSGEKADMVFTDPPYGMNAVKNSGVLKERYNDIQGDESPEIAIKSFKILSSLNVSKMVFWGANYYANELPPSGCWLVWDKKTGQSDQMDCELAWTNFDGVIRKYEQSSEKKERFHPAQKPVNLVKWCLKRWGINCKKILDPFLGSGTTLIACEKLNRICYGMEIEPKYCDVIITRYSNFTDIPEEEIRATREGNG